MNDNEFEEEISIEFTPQDEYQSIFTFDESILFVTLEEGAKEELINGELCPRVNYIDLPFRFASESLGEADVSLSVIIFPNYNFYGSTQSYVVSSDDKLQVQSQKVN